MSEDAPERTLRRLVYAASIGLAALAVGIAGPRELIAADTISCAALLVASPPPSAAQLGWAIAATRDGERSWLAAGTNLDLAQAAFVSIFRNPGPGTPETARLAPPDRQPGDQFGTSVSLDGGRLAVGAPLGDAQAVRGSGVVYLFRWDGATWAQEARLAAADAARGASFGFSVSLAANTLAVGAPGDSPRGSSSGSVYVFALQGGAWQQAAKLHADDGRPFDELGAAVALAGSEIVVGAPFADDLQAFQNFGAAYVFQQDAAGGWALEANGKLTAGAFRPGNIQFGAAVAIGGGRIAVGAPGDDLTVADSGSAYVFERNGSGWTPHRLTADDPRQGAQFGTALQLDGDRVLIGAPFARASAGAAYLFARQGDGTWQLRCRFQPVAAGAFGRSVAVLDNQVFLGGPEYDLPAVTHAGAVATCPLTPVPPVLTCSKTGPVSVPAGGSAAYTITVTNHGDAAVANVVLDDPVPPGLTFVPTGKPCGTGFPCSLGTIGPHQASAPVAVTFRAPTGCAAQGTFTNSATVKGDGVDPVSCNAPPTAILGPPEGPWLTCAKQGPGSAKPGDTVTYGITVGNSGCGPADDVTLSDPTPPGLVLPSVGGGRCTQLPCNLGRIEPGQLLPPVEVSFKVPACVPPSITNTATVTGSDAAPQDCSLVTAMPGIAEVEIAMHAPGQVAGGDSFHSPIVVSNQGPQTARGVTVDVSIAASAIVDGVPAVCGAVGGQPNHFTCRLGDLPCGVSELLDFEVRAPACVACAAGTAMDLAVDEHSRTADPTLPNHAATTVQVTCPPASGLAITTTEAPDPVLPGQGVVYEITAANAGPAAVSGAMVRDTFPIELRKVLWCRGAGCAPILPPPLADTIDLAAGETRVYRLSGIVRPMCSGLLHNLATITPPPGVCDDPADNQAITDTPVVATGVHAFCLGIGGSWMPLTPITKTMLLINCGPANQADNPGDEFTDTLPAGLTLTGASATSGVASTAGNTAHWNGAIPAGGTVTITITASIDPGTVGKTLCNQATIAYDADGNGTNESIGFSDDPDEPGAADPCCFQVIPPNIPAVSGDGLAALALVLAGFALSRLRRRPRWSTKPSRPGTSR